MPPDPIPEPLLIDPIHEITEIRRPTPEEVAALTDAPHGENPELFEGDDR